MNKVMKHRPDVVVFAHTLNDCGLLLLRRGYEDWMVQSAWGDDRWGTLRGLYEWATTHSELFGYLRPQYAVFMIGREQANRFIPTVPSPHSPSLKRPAHDPAAHETAYVVRLRMAAAMVRATGAVPVFITETVRNLAAPVGTVGAPHTQRSSLGGLACYQAFNEHVRSVGREERVPVIDLERQLTGPGLFYDSMHFNDAGSQRAAEVVAQALLEIVPRRR